MEEGFEGGFVLEAGAHAVALFRHDELRFDGVARDDADRWLLAADEIDDVKKVSDEFSICVKFRHVRIGNAPYPRRYTVSSSCLASLDVDG